MMKMSVTHIRKRGAKEVITICGDKGESISWEHFTGTFTNWHSATARHVDSLKICDCCYKAYQRGIINESRR